MLHSEKKETTNDGNMYVAVRGIYNIIIAMYTAAIVYIKQ